VCHIAFIRNYGISLFPTGAAAASRLYVEAINKLARQAQQGTWGGSSDVGKCELITYGIHTPHSFSHSV